MFLNKRDATVCLATPSFLDKNLIIKASRTILPAEADQEFHTFYYLHKNIFVIPSWYPTKDEPRTGISIKEQAV
ncbi:hypothetical protein IMPR6_410043 [Imperialibacter sp. EC-SDR9]|nr:hypothetical protein IMPERIA75_330043 [Imperialibacter sp. 75]CAD5297108.1 hypothetical protein IMPERIA89_70021 [Imperialibacter sp. 89]VVT27245.1 hypothetical protein IMPR6_410043 [Imperialibacter sp. EC-SDR9]